MRIILVCCALLAAVSTACSFDRFLFGGPASQVAPRVNPHGLCAFCHTTKPPASGSAPLNASEDSSAICTDCHDYGENHHPVNFKPADPSKITLPLYEGEVRCLTCHDIHNNRSIAKTPLLRGGPYPNRRDICFRCHYQEQYAGIDPHKMLDSNGNFRVVNGEVVCLICHTTQPDPVEDWTSDVRFKADVAYLCWRCHPPMPDPFFSTHFLIKPNAETLAAMKETEAEKLVILPLVPRDRITCSTCHNPHEQGVLLHESAAKGADAPSRLRLRPLCNACHPTY